MDYASRGGTGAAARADGEVRRRRRERAYAYLVGAELHRLVQSRWLRRAPVAVERLLPEMMLWNERVACTLPERRRRRPRTR